MNDVVRRISVVPSWYNDTNPTEMIGNLENSTDFWELGGAARSTPYGGEEAYPIGEYEKRK